VFVGPVLAMGLYSISHQLGKCLQPVMGHCLREWDNRTDHDFAPPVNPPPKADVLRNEFY